MAQQAMAQQDMSQTAEQSDAAAAAAAIAADIDAMSAERLADLPDAGAEDCRHPPKRRMHHPVPKPQHIL